MRGKIKQTPSQTYFVATFAGVEFAWPVCFGPDYQPDEQPANAWEVPTAPVAPRGVAIDGLDAELAGLGYPGSRMTVWQRGAFVGWITPTQSAEVPL